MKYIIYLILLIGCADVKKKYKTIDPTFNPYIKEVIYMSKGAVTENDFKKFTIGFEDLDGSTVGICRSTSREIGIDRKYWHKASEESKIEVFLHEVGHCILNRYHTNPKDSYFHDIPINMGFIKNTGYLKDSCPSSIMHPYSLNWYCFAKHRNYYIEELFSRADKNSYEPVEWRLEGGDIQIGR